METAQLSVASSNMTISYDWMDESSVAIQSLEPVLDAAAIQTIRNAADALFHQQTQSTKSRFTYQFSTNAEAHVSD